MNRREAVARLIAITGTMAIGGELFLSGCRAPDAEKRTVRFSAADVALMDEIAETIIPATSTPGAKAAGAGAFMAMMSHDCYDDSTFASFRSGLSKIDAASRKHHGKSFMESSPAERTALLNELDREQREHTRNRTAAEPPHYFRLGTTGSEYGASIPFSRTPCEASDHSRAYGRILDHRAVTRGLQSGSSDARRTLVAAYFPRRAYRMTA